MRRNKLLTLHSALHVQKKMYMKCLCEGGNPLKVTQISLTRGSELSIVVSLRQGMLGNMPSRTQEPVKKNPISKGWVEVNGAILLYESRAAATKKGKGKSTILLSAWFSGGG